MDKYFWAEFLYEVKEIKIMNKVFIANNSIFNKMNYL